MLRELCRTPYALNRASNRTLPSVWFQLVKHDKDFRQGIGDLEKHIVTLDRVAELPDTDREQQIRLALAVYPNSDADWSGRNLEWSEPELCVQVRDLAGSLVSFVGVHCRDVFVDGHPVKIGGIGNVKTHPDARRRGFASEGIRRAVAYFHERANIDFALLVCEPSLVGFYSRLGWSEFTGRTLIRKHSKTVAFTFNRPMTIGIRSADPVEGVIDWCGPPW